MWNTHGLGNPRGIRNLYDFIKKEVPHLVFLQETRLTRHAMEKCKLKLGFFNCLTIDYQGRSGGLALLWTTEVQVTIKNYSSNHIRTTIRGNFPTHSCWDITRMYLFLKANNKHRTWERIRSIHQQSKNKWLVGGDFNEVMFQDEKWGGKRKAKNLLLDFCSMVNDCELTDRGYMGPKYTWCNNRKGEACISERIERCLASIDWHVQFPNAVVRHGIAAYSDHLLLWVELKPQVEQGTRKKIFRFEAIWTHEEECCHIIDQTWTKKVLGSPMHVLQ